MSNLAHEITTSRLVFGVSSEVECKTTKEFIEFFVTPTDSDSSSKINSLKLKLDCFEHDPISKISESQINPTKICGVLVGMTHSRICDISSGSLKAAENIFREALSEYNSLVSSEEKDVIHVLKPMLLLFGEGITKWETS